MNHQSSRSGMLRSMAAGISLLLCLAAFQAQAAVPYSHVISNTATSMIDTVYNGQGQVSEINTFAGVAPTPYVYSAQTTYTPPTNSTTMGAYSIDQSSVPTQVTLGEAAHTQGAGDSAIGQTQLPPDVPAPNYTGPVLQGYQTYNGTTGALSNTVYVVYMFSNGTLTGVSTLTGGIPTPPPGSCVPSTDQRPCKQQN